MAEQSAMIVWLDYIEPLGIQQSRQLAEAGWRVVALDHLGELDTVAGSAARVVVRIVDDLSPLFQVRKRLEALGERPEVVARIDRDRFELAVAAAKAGADHVIPADDFSTVSWRPPAGPRPSADTRKRTFVFVDPQSRKLLDLAGRVARAEIGVLITGPTGAGKEVLARVLHEGSPRARGPFVALNCAAMPESLIESILFGHEKGAFTGAHQARIGLFEQANGGTLFLDEIGEMPFSLQSRLLRVLQERELTRLGGQQVIRLDFRLIAATNRDLKLAISNREFREDLYFRISAFRLNIPQLRDRPGDILPLAAHFLARQSRSISIPELNPEAAAALLAHRWPGNVRELENVMQRALVLCGSDRIGTEHLMFDDDTAAPSGLPEPDPQSQPPEALQSAVRASEYQAIMAAIRDSASRNEAAARLGISPRTLRYKLARLREQGQGGCPEYESAGYDEMDEGVAP